MVFAGYDYPLDRSGQVMTELARPTGTATSDDQAVVTANSKGNGKGPGKGRGKGKWTAKSRGKDKSAAKLPRTLKSNGNCTSICNSVATEASEVDDNNSVVTEVGVDESSVVTKDPEAGVERNINEWEQHIALLTKKRDVCSDELESARKELVDAITMHKKTRVLLVQAFALLDYHTKETEEANRARNMVIDMARASNRRKRAIIAGKMSQFVPRPPGLSSP